MARSFLVALVLLGAGVSFAEPPGGYPETYSVAGDAIVRALWQLDDQGVDTALTGLRYSHGPGGTTFSIPVQWDYVTQEGRATYSGVVKVQPRSMYGLIHGFYNAVCQTPDQNDCGLWGSGQTGTSVDVWRNKQWGELAPWTYPEGVWSTDNECSSPSGEVHSFRTRFAPNDPPVVPSLYWNQNQRNDGDPSNASYSSRGNAESGITGSVTIYCRGGAWAENRLDSFRDGHAMFLNMEPPSVADVRDGVRVTFIQAFGEAARLGIVNDGQLVLLEGLSLDPLPLPEEIGAEPPDTGSPGEGGGEIDPGNCEDGWFLTRVVCEIRTQGERLWAFVSHDAWVPERGLSERSESLRNVAGDKIPFAFLGAGDGLYLSIIGNVGSMVEESDDTVIRRWLREDWTPDECPTWSIHPRTFAPWLQPGTVEAVEMNICTTTYGEWMHETGRGWLNMAMIFGLSLWFVTSLLGMGNGR